MGKSSAARRLEHDEDPLFAQQGPQLNLLTCPAHEIMYGGARGGGKSYGLLLDWLRHENLYGKKARGILFRQSFPELEDLMDKALAIFPAFDAVWNSTSKVWKFPSGAKLKLRYLKRDADAALYQGHEYNWMGFDEAGKWPRPRGIDELRACLRSAGGVRHRLILSSNPGGPGHNWLKSRYIDPFPPNTLITEIDPDTGERWVKCYIPAKVSDNALLMKNDPGYISRIKKSGPDWLVRAWLNGDWDIVAGGMFDDVWSRSHHILKPFNIPASWRVDRSFDWGSSKPFAVMWYAESDGTEATLADGTKRCWPRGTVFIIGEWYGTGGDEEKGWNVGCKMLAKNIAKGIKAREAKFPRAVRAGPADSSIFDEQNGMCIAKDMQKMGVKWTKANKAPGSRVNGWEKLRNMLDAAREEIPEDPGLYVFENCRHFIRTCPTLPRDEIDADDVDTDAEDHIADAVRYRLYTKSRRFGEAEMLGV